MKMSRYLFLMSSAHLLVFVLFAGGAFAASPYGYSWSGALATYYINSGLSGLGWSPAINGADAAWDGAGSRFRFNYGGSTTRNASKAYGTNDGYNDVGYRPMGKTGKVAYTYGKVSSSGVYIEVDVAFNTDYSFSSSGSSSAYDVQNTTTHEFGHFLGLDHSSSSCGSSSEATMCDSATMGETRKRSLATDDKDGIKSIYGL